MIGREPSEHEETAYDDAVRKYKENRQTIRLSFTSAYDTLVTNSSLHFFKDELGGVTSLRFTDKGERVAVGFCSGDLQVVTPSQEDSQGSVDVILKGWEGNHSISCLRFHPRRVNFLYASSTSGAICRHDLQSTKIKFQDFFLTEKGTEINSFDFDMSGTKMVTGGTDAVIRVYDTATDKLTRKYGRNRNSDLSQVSSSTVMTNGPHEKRVYCVQGHPSEPSLFATGGWDKIVKVWDVRTAEGCVRSILGPYIFGESIDFCKDKLLTASCVARDSLELWDFGSGNLLTSIVPRNKRAYLYGEFPYAAQFFKGDTCGDLILCGGSGLGGLQLISIKEAEILYLFENEKPVTAVDSKGANIAFGGKSKNILFGSISIQIQNHYLEVKSPQLSNPSSLNISSVSDFSVKKT